MPAWSPSPAPPVARGAWRAALAALALTGALTGCGSGDDAVDDPTSDAASDAASDSASDSASDAEGGTSASPDASGSGTPAGSATAGELTGEGYAVTLPEGWQDATAQFQEYSPLIDAGALDADQAGRSFSDNVNVLRNTDQTELPVAQAEEQFAEELATVASEVRVEEPARVAGVEAVHLTGRTRAGDVVAFTDQYICYVEDAYYVITFSYGEQTPRSQQEEEVSAMLASWTRG